MRWFKTEKSREKERVKVTFLFLPKCLPRKPKTENTCAGPDPTYGSDILISETECRWLEKARIYQILAEYHGVDGEYCSGWCDRYWEE